MLAAEAVICRGQRVEELDYDGTYEHLEIEIRPTGEGITRGIIHLYVSKEGFESMFPLYEGRWKLTLERVP